MRPLRFPRRILLPVMLLVVIAIGLAFWPWKTSGQVQYYKMFGNVVPGDGTTAVYPSNYGASFAGKVGATTCQGTGFFQGGTGFYDTGEGILAGCEGYAQTQPPGYFLERVQPVVITGDTQMNFNVYSQYAWVSGTIRDAITGASFPPGGAAASASWSCVSNHNGSAGASGAADFDFGGVPGQPYYGGRLLVCRSGFTGPGQATFRINAGAGSNYFDETKYLTLQSGEIVSGLSFQMYPNRGNIQGIVRDAITGAPINASVAALWVACPGCNPSSKYATINNGSFTFASSTEPPDWGLWGLIREGDSGPGSNDYTLRVTASGYAQYVSPPVHVTSGQTSIHDVYLVPAGFNPDLGPCDENHCEHNAGHPINLTNGNVWVQQRDYSLPGLAGGLELLRTWNSLWRVNINIETAGMFGDSWRSTYEERLNSLAPNYLRYWRSDGSSWLFVYDSVLQSWSVVSPPNERAWIVFNSGTGVYTLSFLDGTSRTFKNISNGIRLTGIIDRNGNQTTVTHDGIGRTSQVTDAAARSLTFTYPNSSVRQVSSMSDATGVIATYTYGASNRLAQVTYADNTFITFNYDTGLRLLSILDMNGKVLEAHTYTVNKGLTSERAGGVDRITIAYPQDGLTRVTDSLGRVTEYDYGNVSGRLFVFSVSGPGCSTCGGRGNSVFGYDSKGNRTSSTDALGRVTSTTYDIWGNVTSRSVQLDASTTLTWTYTYNAWGQVLTATDPAANVTTNSYDANGNLLSTSQSGITTSFAYDVKGQLTSVTDPRNNSTTFTYTPAGLLATVTDALTNTTTYGYDARGNRTSATDALNNTTSFAYNVMNRLTQVSYPNQSTTAFGYDYRGRRASVTDANTRTTTYAYDDADRLISVTDAASNLTAYAYDTENNLTSITDALGRVTSFAYDAQGRVTSTTFPSTLQETYAYDALGNLLSKTDRKGQTLSYTYDALNRLTRKQYPDATGVDYTYDNLSRLTRAVDPTGTYDFTYDNLGRLTGTTTTYTFLPSRTFTVSYGYDNAGNRTSMTDPEAGVTNYTYDALNRLTSLSNFQSQQFTFSYDGLSRRTQMARPNGVNTAYTYDNLSRLLSVLHQVGGNTLDGATYTVDAVGNRTAKTNHLSSVTDSYTYDAIYQLTQVAQGATTAESYTYDLVGNRLSSLGVSPYTYNSSNHLTSTPATTFAYDNNGNTITKTAAGTTTYSWDFENRLVSTTLPGSQISDFKYDPFGRRIQKVSPTGTTIYVYDGANISEEVDASGAVLARYTHGLGIDEPLAMLRAGVSSYYEANGLGSITSLTDSAGAMAVSYTYDSFGNLTSSTGSIVNPFRYTGREFDSETGLYYYRARYYDVSAGRFLSEDPISFWAGINFYPYVLNNPVNLVDPYGLESGNLNNLVPGPNGEGTTSAPLSRKKCGCGQGRGKSAGGFLAAVPLALGAAAADGPIPAGDAIGIAMLLAAAASTPRAVPIPVDDAVPRELPRCTEDDRDGECWEQYARDVAICRKLRSRRCYASAMERLVQCRRGGYVPPLVTW